MTKANTFPKVPESGKCSKCGSESFTLAEDITCYTNGIVFEGSKPLIEGGHDSDLCGVEDPVRFYCGVCKERYAIPAELLPPEMCETGAKQ